VKTKNSQRISLGKDAVALLIWADGVSHTCINDLDSIEQARAIRLIGSLTERLRLESGTYVRGFILTRQYEWIEV